MPQFITGTPESSAQNTEFLAESTRTRKRSPAPRPAGTGIEKSRPPVLIRSSVAPAPCGTVIIASPSDGTAIGQGRWASGAYDGDSREQAELADCKTLAKVRLGLHRSADDFC